jgi:hypothetical protein
MNYSDSVWQTLTGKTVDQLWDDYSKSGSAWMRLEFY